VQGERHSLIRGRGVSPDAFASNFRDSLPAYVAAVDAVLATRREAMPAATTASGLPAAP